MDLIPAFVISPLAFEERRKLVSEEFGKIGLPFKFFNGLNGKDTKLISGYNNPKRPLSHYKDMSSGMLCCSLNHWFVWQHIVLSEIEEALVFEDDVCFSDDFQTFFDCKLRTTPLDWEMIYLSILYPERIDDGRIATEKVGQDLYRHIRAKTWDGACDGLHAYAIKLSAARKFTSLPLKLDESMDRWISFYGLPLVKTYIWRNFGVRQSQKVASTTWS